MKFYDYTNAPNPRVVRMFAAEKSVLLPTVMVDVPGDQVIREILPIYEYIEGLNASLPVIGVASGHVGSS